MGSPLHPVIESLRRAVAIGVADGVSEAEKKLEQWLSEQGVATSETPYFARLLGISLTDRYPSLDAHPEVLRRRTLEMLLSVIGGLSSNRPVLLVAEDLHWADPTTVELLGLTIERLHSQQMLALFTFRPEFDAPWPMQPHVTALSLNHLTAGECQALATAVAREHNVSADVVTPIVERADGVPLFVEELARTVIESDETAGAFVPEGLQDALMARLDRLGPAKRLAQHAAVIGRDFTTEVLSQITEEDALGAKLEKLVAADLLRSMPGGNHFRFKHALIHEVAYQSLLSSERNTIHGRVALSLERLEPPAEPELLALHFAEAGELDQAVAYRKLAGRAAAEASALKEAEANYEVALSLLDDLSPSEARTQRGVELLSLLGAVQMVVYGFGSLDVKSTYEKARDLNEGLSAPVEEFEVMWGLWLNRQMRSEFTEAQRLATLVFTLAQKTDDSGHHLQAHHAEWMTALSLGDVLSAYEHSERGLAIYDSDLHGDHAFRYGGHDPAVCGGGHNAISSWLMGFPDRALTRWETAQALAARLEHRGSIGIGRHFGVWLLQLLGDTERIIELTEDTEGAPAHLRAQSAVIRGWAIAGMGDVADGIAQCEQGLASYTRTGASVRLAYLHGLLAEALRRAGQRKDALAACDDALRRLADGSERWLRPELHRLKAELLLEERNGWELARNELDSAIRSARSLGARSLELRATLSMSRLLAGRGAEFFNDTATTEIYTAFTEGFDTKDLAAASEMLQQLG
jgi:predicted ATPase